MSNERRRHPRFSLDQMVELGFDRERFVEAEGINASENGILCKTDSKFEKYAKVFMMLSLPIGRRIETIRCEGIVIRSEEKEGYWDTGISITDLSDKDRASLAEYFKETEE